MRKYARIIIAVFGVVFAGFVALQFQRRLPAPPPAAAVATDPRAVVESTGGETQRFKSSREDVRVQYERLLTYADGTSTLVGVTITTEDRTNPKRSFTLTAKEGKLGQNESSYTLDGDVRLASSDGVTATAEHATYSDATGAVQAPGPVTFAKGAMRGKGTGLEYDKNRDVLSILQDAVLHVDAGSDGAQSPTEITAGVAAFWRREGQIHFERAVRIERGGQLMEADAAVAMLSADEKRIESLELHNRASITTADAAAGHLQRLTGADMRLTYAPDGQSLQHAVITGEASAQLAGAKGAAGRQIAARLLDISLAPDGTTPTAVAGRDAVQLTLPADAGAPSRSIQADVLDSTGEPGRGLTRATFTGSVKFRETGATNRAANSAALEVAMKPVTGEIEEARFLRNVRFEEGGLAAQAADGRYDLNKGTLALTGSEPATPTPRVVNERIAVDATRIDIVLDGPKLNAAGDVKSTLQPASREKQQKSKPAARLPTMLKQDQPVTVLADKLAYDGDASLATYTGSARLFQAETTIKGDTITIDEKAGDLSASGNAMSTTVREQQSKDGKKTRTSSMASAANLKYEDAPRRLTYTGGAHLVGPEGDITAAKIELYLNESGDDVQRAEAYAEAKEKLTLREQNRTTTGTRMTYTADRETYVVTGVPATVVDECGRETIGRTLTFVKSTDTIVVDGNQQIRTQTRGGSGKCS